MEILKDIKPDNQIEYIEELNIPCIEKEPLYIETLDYLAIEVDQRLRAVKRSKIYEIERDTLEILSKPKGRNTVIDVSVMKTYYKSIYSFKTTEKKIEL